MTQPVSPFVFHVPHSSYVIPADVRPTFALTDDALHCELIAMTDGHTDALFDVGPAGATITFPVSRLVIDPERYLDDTQEPMAARGMGVVYTVTSTGHRLRSTPSTDERRTLIDRFYTPHHQALEAAVDAAISRHSMCILIDCHSFPSTPRPYEIDPIVNRPDICLGTNDFHTPSWLHEVVSSVFRSSGVSVTLDRPYARTIVPSKYSGRAINVYSLMIEVNRRLYMDEISGERLSAFSDVAKVIGAAVRALADDVAERLPVRMKVV